MFSTITFAAPISGFASESGPSDGVEAEAAGAAAAFAGFTVCYMLLHRNLKEPNAAQEHGDASGTAVEQIAEDSTRVKPINTPIVRECD